MTALNEPVAMAGLFDADLTVTDLDRSMAFYRAVVGLCSAGNAATRRRVLLDRWGRVPAAGLYFRDPDGHFLEYLAMLNEPARPERGIVP